MIVYRISLYYTKINGVDNMEYLLYYLYGINIISFLLYGLDKLLAILKWRRISEKMLLFSSLMGGCFLASVAMILFHHKIRKKYFWLINIMGIIIYLSIIGGFYGNR